MAPRPRDSIGLYWTDEAIIMSLEGMEKGSPVPENVSVDVNPYQCKPSYLPDGIWYLIHPDHNKKSEHGFWRARGEATEIFMNSVIKGWRTTLDFYEGRAPHGQRTNWVMQEYRITQKGLCSYRNPKESSLLCRVFLSSGGPNQETKLNLGGKEIAGVDHIHPKPSVVPKSGSTTGQRYMSESQVRNRDDNTGPLDYDDIYDDDCFSSGDYLELDDLVDGESKSSSSDNSFCLTPTSVKYFDSEALLRDLGAKINRDEQGKDANVKLSVAALIKPNDVVMRPSNLAPSKDVINMVHIAGSLVKNDGRKSPAKTIDKKFLDQKVPENAIRSKKARTWNEGTSNSHDVATSSSSHKAIPRGKKKAVAGRTKKLKKYLCFMPF
ncbi:NAC domain-containing protein [Actinidia chinensis var. chinensis]|uniref:NAC domain-containing protein n=1 Tax=Actinidia chinensis var. chinensis TaxID=1590841 RepID=A0A2R6PZX6_ACTCC|nr:NAC domain-containing protein [Actinidia chinensis var. chinensis]